MKNFIKSGNSITIPAPQDVASGQALLVGDCFGIFATSAKAGENVELYVEGTFELPKVAGAIPICTQLYWDPNYLDRAHPNILPGLNYDRPMTVPGACTLTGDPKDRKIIGVSSSSALDNEPTILVRLNAVFPLQIGIIKV